MGELKDRLRRIGDRFYDFGTENKSFVRLANNLKELGMKEWYYPLEIRDLFLCHINPLDVDKLSKQDKVRVFTECKKNPWYYFREIAKFDANSVTIASMLELWRSTCGNSDGCAAWIATTLMKGDGTKV